MATEKWGEERLIEMHSAYSSSLIPHFREHIYSKVISDGELIKLVLKFVCLLIGQFET